MAQGAVLKFRNDPDWRVASLKIVEFEVRLGQDFTEKNTHRMRAMKIWSVIKAWDHFKADIG